ncbi:MAG: hypothetical protein IKP67_03875 [Spirochaetales bacterium]|nr:hypothetical protein [Spirochaetales bacterium]
MTYEILEKSKIKPQDTEFIDNMIGILSHGEVEEMRENCHLKFKEIEI